MPCCPAGAQEIPPVRIRGSVVPVHCPPIRNAPLSQNVCESYSDCSGTPQTAGHTDLHLYRRLAPVWRLPPAGGATHQDCVRPPDCIGFQCQYGEECLGTVSANHVHRCAARLRHSDSPSSAGPSGPIPISPLTVSRRQHSDLQTVYGADWDYGFLHLPHSPRPVPHETIPALGALSTDPPVTGQETSDRYERRGLGPASLEDGTFPDPRSRDRSSAF